MSLKLRDEDRTRSSTLFSYLVGGTADPQADVAIGLFRASESRTGRSGSVVDVRLTSDDSARPTDQRPPIIGVSSSLRPLGTAKS